MDTLENLMKVSKHSMPSEDSIRNTIKLHNLWNAGRGHYSINNPNSTNRLCVEKFISEFEKLLVLHRLGIDMSTIITQLKLEEK